jgi:hypothetical protein
VIFGCPHTTGSSPVAALSAGRLNRPRAALTSKITNSGWSINRLFVMKRGGTYSQR